MKYQDIVFVDASDTIFRFFATQETNQGDVTFVYSTKDNQNHLTVTLNYNTTCIDSAEIIGTVLTKYTSEDYSLSAFEMDEIFVRKYADDEKEEKHSEGLTEEERNELREKLGAVIKKLAENISQADQ